MFEIAQQKLKKPAWRVANVDQPERDQRGSLDKRRNIELRSSERLECGNMDCQKLGKGGILRATLR